MTTTSQDHDYTGIINAMNDAIPHPRMEHRLTPSFVKKCRRAWGLSRAQLAKKMGYSKAYIANIEKRKPPVTKEFKRRFDILKSQLGPPATQPPRVRRPSRLRLERDALVLALCAETCTCSPRLVDVDDVPLSALPGHHDFTCGFRSAMQPVLKVRNNYGKELC